MREKIVWPFESIEQACDAYGNDRIDRAQKNLENKWQLLFQTGICSLTNTILERSPTVIEEVHDEFLSFEKKTFLSYPYFTVSIQNVYGRRNVNPLKNKTSTFRRLYHSFDTLNRGEMNWREFVFMLHVACHQEFTSKEHIKWAFRYFTCKDPFRNKSTSHPRVRLGIFASIILHPLVRTDRLHEIKEIIDDSWFRVISKLDSTSMFENVSSKGEIIVSYECFLEMIEQPCFLSFFTSILTQGKAPFTWWRDRFEDR